jgi:hypothetical protein
MAPTRNSRHSCGILRIKIVVLAALPTIPAVWCRDLQDLDAGVLQVAKKSRAVGACCLDADPPKLAERAHPGEHLLVAVPGRWEALAAENPVMFVDDGGDMEILVCIDAADDETVGDALLDLHGRTPEGECIGASANTECLDRTVTRQNVRPFSGHMHRQGEPRRQVFPGGRQIRGKTRMAVDRSAGQAAPRHLAAPAILNGRSL